MKSSFNALPKYFSQSHVRLNLGSGDCSSKMRSSVQNHLGLGMNCLRAPVLCGASPVPRDKPVSAKVRGGQRIDGSTAVGICRIGLERRRKSAYASMHETTAFTHRYTMRRPSVCCCPVRGGRAWSRGCNSLV